MGLHLPLAERMTMFFAPSIEACLSPSSNSFHFLPDACFQVFERRVSPLSIFSEFQIPFRIGFFSVSQKSDGRPICRANNSDPRARGFLQRLDLSPPTQRANGDSYVEVFQFSIRPTPSLPVLWYFAHALHQPQLLQGPVSGPKKTYSSFELHRVG